MHISDLKQQTLSLEGYGEHVSDGIHAWLLAETGAEGIIPRQTSGICSYPGRATWHIGG